MKRYSKITILMPDIYDSFIYKKKLYLVTAQRKIIPVDWVDFIKSLMPKGKSLPFEVSFSRSDLLYSPQFEIFMQDEELKNHLIKRFEEISDITINFNDSSFLNFVANKRYWRELSELPRQIRCAFNKFFVLNDNEVLTAEIKSGSVKQKRNVLSPFRLFAKGSFVSMDFVGRDIFFAGLNNGVFVSDYFDESYSEELRQVSQHHASYISNNYSSLTIGSYVGDSFLINTEKEYRSDEERKILNTETNISKRFNTNKGCVLCSFRDKIYCIEDNSIKLMTYKNKDRDISDSSTILEKSLNRKIISSEVAVFGLIIECEKSILVFPSDGSEQIEIGRDEDPIIGWRIFPNSIDYKNQIHIYFNDRIEIWSFNHDYFINQNKKKFGFSFFEKKYNSPYGH